MSKSEVRCREKKFGRWTHSAP